MEGTLHDHVRTAYYTFSTLALLTTIIGTFVWRHSLRLTRLEDAHRFHVTEMHRDLMSRIEKKLDDLSGEVKDVRATVNGHAREIGTLTGRLELATATLEQLVSRLGRRG